MKTEHDLLTACQKIHDSGAKLSVRALQKELGGGSTDRIAATIRKFKAMIEEKKENSLVTDLSQTIKNLIENYEALKHEHEQRVEEIKELKKHIVKLQDTYGRAIKKLKSENKDIHKKLAEISDTEEEITSDQPLTLRQRSLLS